MKTKRMLAQLLTGLILLLASTALAAEPASQPVSTDWPQWRGPNRDGVAPAGPKLLDAWPKGGPKQLWKSEFIPGAEDGGCGSIAVAEGKAFVYVNWGSPVALATKRLKECGWEEGLSDDLVKKIEAARTSPERAKLKTENEIETYIKEFMATIDPQRAQKHADFIRKRVGKEAGYGSFDWPTLTKWAELRDKEFPTIDALSKAMGILVFHYKTRILDGGWPDRTFSDTVMCLDAATGKTIWKKEFPTKGPGNNWAASSTVAIAHGRCYAVGSGGVYCLSVKDGSVIWQVKSKYSNSSPLVANGAICFVDPDLNAYDAETGRLLWKLPVAGGPYWHMPNASVVEWVSGGKSYLVGVSEGGLYCVEADKGKMLWQVRDCTVGEGGSTPALSGDTLVADCDSSIKAFKLTPQKPELLWTTKPGNHRAGSPVIQRGLVYVIGDNGGMGLRCLDLKTGEVKWSAKGVSVNYASLIVADDKILCPNGGRDFLYMDMLKATPEKCEVTGSFGKSPDERHIVSCCSSPALADGRLYLRLKDAVACYDLTEAGNK